MSEKNPQEKPRKTDTVYMQKIQAKLLETRAASPIARIGARIARDGLSVRFYATTVCEHCAGEIALDAGFVWSERGWYKGDYNRAEAYADVTQVAHGAHQKCN